MAGKIEIQINGKTIPASDRETLLAVCNRENIYVPTLCHHPRLEPYGVCRVCLVKVTWGVKSKYITACNYPVENGDVIDTESEDVIKLRKLSIEALFGRCPRACSAIRLSSKKAVRAECVFPNESLPAGTSQSIPALVPRSISPELDSKNWPQISSIRMKRPFSVVATVPSTQTG